MGTALKEMEYIFTNYLEHYVDCLQTNIFKYNTINLSLIFAESLYFSRKAFFKTLGRGFLGGSNISVGPSQSFQALW